MSQQYYTKTQAVNIISVETGYGRRVIEHKMDELTAEGKINIIPDPIYSRQFRITRAEIDIVISTLKEAGG